MRPCQPPDPGAAILAAAYELRDVAAALGAPYLTAHLPAAEGETVALTVEEGTVDAGRPRLRRAARRRTARAELRPNELAPA